MEGRGDRGQAPSRDCGAQGLGTYCDPASLSRIPWIGERERNYLRRAPYRGWKTWSLSSPAEKLRLRDPWRTGPSRCPCRDGKGNTSFQTLVLQLHLCPCASGSLSTSQGVGLGIESGMGPLRNTSPSAHILPSPHSPWGFVRPRSPKEESPAGDCISSPRSPLSPGPRPALIGSKPLALFPWPRRPASTPQPPLPSPFGLRLQAPPAPPPANVALGPGPGPDSPTRPSRSPRSSEGETRRAPGLRPTSCEALDTWIILVGDWVGGRVGSKPGAES